MTQQTDDTAALIAEARKRAAISRDGEWISTLTAALERAQAEIAMLRAWDCQSLEGLPDDIEEQARAALEPRP